MVAGRARSGRPRSQLRAAFSDAVGGTGTGLPRHHPELTHHPELVVLVPVFRHLAGAVPEDVDLADRR